MKNLIIILILLSINLAGSNLLAAKKNIPATKTKKVFVKQQNELDKLYSSKALGVISEESKTTFRLFAPNAETVSAVIFEKPEDNNGTIIPMTKDENGVWEGSIEGVFYGKFYNFSVKHKNNEPVLCLDPYAKAVATYNTYFGQRKGIIVKEGDYDWGKDKWIRRDWRDLIVYEAHIKDLTAHPTSGAKNPGTYKGLIEKGIKGGLAYVKNLGINTIELLPSQEYANIEIPFKDTIKGKFNTWNPYERNHWGYMTSAFFAPDEYYTTPGEIKWDVWAGTDGSQITQFKDMVKAFHKEGIAVVMDVVYNHLSEYDFGNLKEIDKEYYFRLDENGNYRAESGCGNDIKTERLMMRRMIVESILYWMKEYHVDGFRFDLGKLIDWVTVEEIIREAKKINPDVIIVCEPWGGGYDPAGFSLRGWGSWNDQIRNGIKGENPENGLGWIFGKWYGNNNVDRIKSYVNGTLVKDKFGLFQKKEHAVNYLESHDGYTFGDFVRIGTKEVGANQIIKDVDANAKLSPLQLKLNKLGALFLFTSQGMTMIHSGQEFARSKVIPFDLKVEDEHKGMIDHNTYNKDNEVNYINYKHAEMNKDLLNYYKGLILFRNSFEAFRRADYDKINFLTDANNEFALGYMLEYKKDIFYVLFNANPDKKQDAQLPDGKWSVLIDKDKAGNKELRIAENIITIEPTSGIVLKLKK